MQLLKNLVFHDLQRRDILSKLERKGSEIWYASTFDGAVGKQELLAAYLNQIELAGARSSASTEPADTTFERSRET